MAGRKFTKNATVSMNILKGQFVRYSVCSEGNCEQLVKFGENDCEDCMNVI